jgi:hypothetical protein
MNFMRDKKHPPTEQAAEQSGAVFGFEEFWSKIYGKYKHYFDAINDLICLGNEIVEAAEKNASEPVANVICALTRATMSGACEAVLLCGNGCGTGAMKIVRGMYESRWMAEYLRRNPEEAKDYLEFSKVLLWRRLKWAEEYKANSVPPEALEKAEADYKQVRGQFTDSNGKVRHQWCKKSIGSIAKEIGREKEYELPYSIACSIHHGNFEGLAAQWVSGEGAATPNVPPSKDWVKRALTAAWANLWFALNTLNDAFGLDYSKNLEASHKDFVRVGTEQEPGK